MQRRRFDRWCAAVALVLLVASQAVAADFPAWAYPGCPVKHEAGKPHDADPRAVPGSDQHFSVEAIAVRSEVHDWFPAEHSPAPNVVTRSGRPDHFACGYCHLPDGNGRPENAKLAGLPASYIVSQVKALRSHERRAAQADWSPTNLMVGATQELTDAELASAAEYFADQRPRSFVQVVEQAAVPAHVTACFAYASAPGAPVELGASIVELPVDFSRFELRDPHVTYQAYVPPGSVERGRALAETGGGITQPCAECHGAGLKGDPSLPGPPLAGRFPAYLYRQLYSIQSGARGGAITGPMRPVVAHLSSSDMIDLAAYAASLEP